MARTRGRFARASATSLIATTLATVLAPGAIPAAADEADEAVDEPEDEADEGVRGTITDGDGEPRSRVVIPIATADGEPVEEAGFGLSILLRNLIQIVDGASSRPYFGYTIQQALVLGPVSTSNG